MAEVWRETHLLTGSYRLGKLHSSPITEGTTYGCLAACAGMIAPPVILVNAHCLSNFLTPSNTDSFTQPRHLIVVLRSRECVQRKSEEYATSVLPLSAATGHSNTISHLIEPLKASSGRHHNTDIVLLHRRIKNNEPSRSVDTL